MSYTIKYKVVSIKYPDKTYSSDTAFWDDHRDQLGDPNNIIDDVNTLEISDLKNPVNLNARYIAEGKLISDLSTLSDDGTYVIYTKVYKDEQTLENYQSDRLLLTEGFANRPIDSDSGETELDVIEYSILETSTD